MIQVTLGQTKGEVNENIYGQFIEHALDCIEGGIYAPDTAWADEDGIRSDVLEKARELAPSVLRFPGGTVMCQYHWEDAVGPQEKRIKRKNLIWGGELDPSFGTAEFVQFCHKLGAEPMICVNMASGTPEEAGNWVEYCNGTGDSYYANLRRQHGFEKPFGVKYWCIGNESYAEPDIGVHHDVNLYLRDAWEFIKFMKLTDDSIKLVIVGCDKEEWNKPVLDALHAVIDYFSVHFYAGEGNRGLYGPFESEKHLRSLLHKVGSLLDTYPEQVTDFNPWYRFSPRAEKIKIALDEWNIWDFVADETYGLQQVYNWRDALWVASVLNLLIVEPHIGMANMAQMVNVLAPILAKEQGSWYQTIGYPLRLYRKAMIGERVEVSFESPMVDGGPAGMLEAVSITAVRNEDGSIRVAAVNRDMEKEYAICLTGIVYGKLPEQAYMTTLVTDSPRAICTMEQNYVQEIREEVDIERIVLRAGSVNLITIEKCNLQKGMDMKDYVIARNDKHIDNNHK